MADIWLKRTLTGFAPADDEATETAKRYKLGELYRGKIVKPRSGPAHRLCFALLSLTFANQDTYKDFRQFRRWLAWKVDHTDEVMDPSGEIIKFPRSLSFDDVDQVEFDKLFPKMMTACAHLLHDIGLEELEAEVARYADENY
jgi:hypothetical protein